MSAIAKNVDWQAIERDYRAGVLSLREMATLHGINHVSIKKRADKEGWTRDLAAKIQAKADAIVNRDVANRSANTVIDLASERETVDANAQAVANVKIGLRKSITRLGKLAESLMDELEQQTADPAMLAQFGELMRNNPNEFGQDRLNDLYQKIISTPGRIDTTKKLAETLKMYVSMQREAWGMDKANDDDKPVGALASLLMGMQRSALPIVHEVERDDSV